MTTDEPATRSTKGAAQRRAILDAALAIVAERGYRNSSLQEIADAVGLSKAGVLHYFTSREELIAEVVRERDARDFTGLGDQSRDMLELLAIASRHNQTVPGLVEMYSRLVVEAESPEHPAHGYVRDRYARTVDAVVDAIRERQNAGTLRAGPDPLVLARMIVAISDGVQLQWLYDRSIDMSGVLDMALTLAGRETA
jgi:AcrR family transcriptional regulator